MAKPKQRALELALTQIGVEEATGQNDGPVERYSREKGVAWCAAFVLWCNDRSDEVDLTPRAADFWLLRSVAAFEKRVKFLGYWRQPGCVVLPGDYVFFGTRGGSDSAAGGRHMGIVERVEDTVLHTVEGNLGNAVRRARHDLAARAVRARVTGYARIPLRSGE
jgi:hypothetical protein